MAVCCWVWLILPTEHLSWCLSPWASQHSKRFRGQWGHRRMRRRCLGENRAARRARDCGTTQTCRTGNACLGGISVLCVSVCPCVHARACSCACMCAEQSCRLRNWTEWLVQYIWGVRNRVSKALPVISNYWSYKCRICVWVQPTTLLNRPLCSKTTGL